MRALFKFYFSKRGQLIWLILLLLFPFVLWILPGDFFDGDGISMCPSRLFFNIECFGCGMTRAVQHMHHFQIEDAIYYNIGVLAVYPALIGVWFWWVWAALKRLGWIPATGKKVVG